MEQMEKNQEERSLLMEQREQEKEQMLGYMEQLQEEDLRVTGQTDNAGFHQQQGQSSPGLGVSGGGPICCQARAHFAKPSLSAFMAMLNVHLAVAPYWGSSRDLDSCGLPPGDLGSETNASTGMDTERKYTALCIAPVNIGMFLGLSTAG